MLHSLIVFLFVLMALLIPIEAVNDNNETEVFFIIIELPDEEPDFSVKQITEAMNRKEMRDATAKRIATRKNG